MAELEAVGDILGSKSFSEKLAEIHERHQAASVQMTSTGANQKTKPTDGETARARKEQKSRLETAGIRRRFVDVTFDSIEGHGLPQDMMIRRNYEQVKKYVEHLDEEVRAGHGIIMAGGYGTMKTTFAIAILREWLDMKETNYGLFVPMCSLIDRLFTLRDLNRQECSEYDKRIRSTPLLILDDLGGEDTDKKWVLAKVDSIITDRYNDNLATIVTTNFDKNALMGTYSGRIMDRLRSTSYFMAFGDGSQRQPLQMAW